MNTVDAVCTDCGEVIQGGWLSGTLRLCKACYKRRDLPKPETLRNLSELCPTCNERVDGHTHITEQARPETVFVALCECEDDESPCAPSVLVLCVSRDRAKAAAALDDGHSDGLHKHGIQEFVLS